MTSPKPPASPDDRARPAMPGCDHCHGTGLIDSVTMAGDPCLRECPDCPQRAAAPSLRQDPEPAEGHADDPGARVIAAAERYVRAQTAFAEFSREHPQEEWAPPAMYDEDEAAMTELAEAVRSLTSRGGGSRKDGGK